MREIQRVTGLEVPFDPIDLTDPNGFAGATGLFRLNPKGLVPTLVHEGNALYHIAQSEGTQVPADSPIVSIAGAGPTAIGRQLPDAQAPKATV